MISMMKIKTLMLTVLLSLVFFVIVLFPITVSSEPTVIYVGGEGNNNYDSIQKAIDNANKGDTIEIFPGTYQGNIVIDKSLTIKGVDKETTILVGSGSGNIIEILADNVTLQNLTIKNATLDSTSVNQTLTGVYVKSNSSMITDCVVMNCNVGIILKNSTNHTLKNLVVTNNNGGIDVFNVTSSRITFSEVSNNKVLWGLSIRKTQGTVVNNCNISFNYVGVGVSQSSDNRFTRNIISKNFDIGLYIVRDAEGICCKNNRIFENNFIGNQGLNAKDNCDDNLWDNEILGNYWDDYDGVDEDGDGIGDSQWLIFGGLVENYDRFPLMNPLDINLNPVASENIIVIGFPLNNSKINGSITIFGSVSNKDVTSVRIRVDNGEWDEAIGTSSWSYVLDTTEYDNGNHMIYVEATDAQGLTITRSIQVNIDNSVSKTRNGGGTPGFSIISLFLGVILMLMISKYYFNRKN
ncbi:MAG: hypothetical protein DRQ06_05855 [Candidatus Hydrothermota bacterium]|nr:MAG: hypothetical protein DRQ06_05855 [Candidatus Hydrothermae bacterium]